MYMSCFHQDIARQVLPRSIEFCHERRSSSASTTPLPARALQQVLGALAHANDESETDSEAGVVVLAPVSEAGRGA